MGYLINASWEVATEQDNNDFDISVDLVEGAVDAQAAIDELYLPIVRPHLRHSFAHQQDFARQITVAMVAGMNAAGTIIGGFTPLPAELN